LEEETTFGAVLAHLIIETAIIIILLVVT